MWTSAFGGVVGVSGNLIDRLFRLLERLELQLVLVVDPHLLLIGSGADLDRCRLATGRGHRGLDRLVKLAFGHCGPVVVDLKRWRRTPILCSK